MSRDSTNSTNQVLFEASDTNVPAEVPCTFWLQVVFPTLSGSRADIGVAFVLRSSALRAFWRGHARLGLF